MSEKKITWDDVILEYIEPGGVVPLLRGEDGETCYTLKDETPESVRKRIERSKKAKRNLFFEECPVYKFEYTPGAMY